MRKLILLLASIYLFSLLTAPVFASDIKDKSSSNSHSLCVAYAQGNVALFYFPTVDNSKWVWFQNNTKDNALEYSWEILITSSNKSYKFGSFLFKYPGKQQKDGSLQKLLWDAQTSVFESVLKPNGGTSDSLRDDLKISAEIIRDGVVIRIDDSNTFNTILKDKPKTAYFTVKNPAQNDFKCETAIDYYLMVSSFQR